MGVGWLLGIAGMLVFQRFVSHDSIRFARDIDVGIVYLVMFISLEVCLAVIDKDKSRDDLSITNTGSGSETRERVNRSSPEVKEQ